MIADVIVELWYRVLQTDLKNWCLLRPLYHFKNFGLMRHVQAYGAGRISATSCLGFQANPCATAPLFKMTGAKARGFFCNWRISVRFLKSKHGNAHFSQRPELFYAGLPRQTRRVAKRVTMQRCAHLWLSYPEPVRQRFVSRVQHADAPLAFGNFWYACKLTIPTGLTMVTAVILMSCM